MVVGRPPALIPAQEIERQVVFIGEAIELPTLTGDLGAASVLLVVGTSLIAVGGWGMRPESLPRGAVPPQ